MNHDNGICSCKQLPYRYRYIHYHQRNYWHEWYTLECSQCGCQLRHYDNETIRKRLKLGLFKLEKRLNRSQYVEKTY